MALRKRTSDNSVKYVSDVDQSHSKQTPFQIELLADIERVKKKDLEDLVNRMQLTYDEIVDILDEKNIAASTKAYTLPPGIDEVTDIIVLLNSSLPDDIKVNITIDDITLRSNLTTNKTIRFSKKSFFCTLIEFTQSHLGPLNEPPQGFIHKTPRTYKTEKTL